MNIQEAIADNIEDEPLYNQINPEGQHMSLTATLEERLCSIGEEISANGKVADELDQFSSRNYTLLKEAKIFSALVPQAFGGGNHSYEEVCNMLTQLATYHPSTALSCSMHQHIIAANRYNHIKGNPGKALLEKVAAQELVLVSTGAGDWLASNGELTKTEGGYYFNGIKHFASGSPSGDLIVTSGPFEDPDEGWQVLHFPVPTSAEGVTVQENWQPMGMRGTGSNSIKLENVFIPEASIALKRPRGDYHSMWSTVLPVALPLIMSVYLGIAEIAAKRAKERCKSSNDPVTPYILGEMENALTTTRIAVADMIKIVDEFNFTADIAIANEMVKRKSIAAAASKEAVAKAVEVCGGPGYLRPFGIECLLRDVMASHFHPLQEKRQLLFTGSLAMGKEPPSQAF